VRDSRGDLRVMPASLRADRKSGWNRVVRARSSRRSTVRKPTKKTTAKKPASSTSSE
jgi:hypothetical protein